MNREITDELKTFWGQLTFSYTGEKELISRYWTEIYHHYSDSSRHYHNLSHIQSIILLINQNQRLILNPQALFFAAFYHDIIYDITRNDSENQSADLAELRLKELGVDTATITIVSQIIRHTANPLRTAYFDINLFLDFDHTILSANETDYRQYANQVRLEYIIFSDKIYTAARARILAQRLAQSEIYYTPVMKSREQAARRNMKNELALLWGKDKSDENR